MFDLATRSALSGLLLGFIGCAEPSMATRSQHVEGEPAAPVIAIPVDAPAESVGRWSPNLIDGEQPAVNIALLHDGRIMYYSGYEAHVERDHGELANYLSTEFVTGHPHEADTRVMRLVGDSATIETPQNSMGTRPGDLFCTGLTHLADGRVLAVGGTDWDPILEDNPEWTFFYGLKLSQLFVPNQPAWQPTANMNASRWYPSLIKLANGDALVASGLLVSGTSQMQRGVEIYHPATATWRDMGVSGEWSLPMYPRLTVIPSGPLAGKVYYAPNGSLWAPSGVDAREATWSLQQVYDPQTGTVALHAPSLLGARQNGVSVLLPLDHRDGYRGRVLTFGGTLQPTAVATATAELSDLGTSSPMATPRAPMNLGRWMANGVVLPDGSVFAVGGAVYDNVTVFGQPTLYLMNPELYDPATNTWSLLPPMQVPRGYHATAILLPDGRVLVGSTVTVPFPSDFVRDHVELEDQIVERRFEIYQPPYLFRGARPVVTDAPDAIRYGETFNLDVTASSPIHSVVMVQPGATTHGYDSGQRAIQLPFQSNGATKVSVTAPPNGNVAPPGYMMLFVNRQTPGGPVPSEAVFVRLR